MRSAACATLAFAVLALAACSAEPPPRVPEPPPPEPAAPPPKAEPAPAAAPTDGCGTPAACVAAGKAAAERKDFYEAVRLFRMACYEGDGEACTAAAQALTDRPGGAKGNEVAPLLEKGCAQGAAGACNGMGQLAHKVGDDKEAAEYFDKGCALGKSAACHNLGVLLETGAIPRDDKRLAAARERACKGGQQEDCAPLSPKAGGGDAVPASVPGANLSVESMEVDGVLVQGLSCKVDGVGLLGAMVIAGTLAKQRTAIRACGVKAPVPVSWTIRGSTVVDASASTGDKKRDACVVRALKQIRSTDDGMCRAKVGLK